MQRCGLILVVLLGVYCGADLPGLSAQNPPTGWKRHTIDDSLRGADGVKFADANGDGLTDIVTGWEESGITRAYFHPGFSLVKQQWPQVTVGSTPATEDAVWVDLNQDGQLDVLSCCEGREQSLRAHFAPSPEQLLHSSAWQTSVVPASHKQTRWMFATPMPTTAGGEPRGASTQIVVGSKAPQGMVGILAVNGPDPAEWTIQKLADAAWIMSIDLLDVDADGDLDILYSDRKPPDSGVYWLENPGQASLPESSSWPRHRVGAQGTEVMFIAFSHAERPRAPAWQLPTKVYVGVKPNWVYCFEPDKSSDLTAPWPLARIEVQPTERIGRTKGIAAGDLDGDGSDELVFSCESASPPKSGVVQLKQTRPGEWQMSDISGPSGIKFDLIELVDLDGDGDLDVITCEERHNNRGLGVIWYENPHISR